jgi:D-tyrosyl-tRNA(Tyr) deacylase
MRALIQRVLEAKVVVEGQTTGEIQHGLLVFLGLGKSDTLEQGQKLIDKILKYRIFDDEQGKMGWNLSQAQGDFYWFHNLLDGANTKRLTS